MKERITLQVILEHIQASKNDLQQQIARLDGKVDNLEKRMILGFENVRLKFEDVDRQFEDAHLHRQALQEDLEETMRVQMKHGRQLNRIQSV